jgi:hypothetical protein
MVYSRLAGTAGTALTSILAGGTAAPSVFYQQAPDSASLPYVVFLYPSGIDDNTSSRRLKDVVLRVYGVAANPAAAGTIDARIDTLLHRQTFASAGGWQNIRLQRENDYQLVTTNAAGVRYYTSGADYRAEITTTA